MTTTYQQTDTAATFDVGCSGQTAAGGTAARQAVEGGTAGVTQVVCEPNWDSTSAAFAFDCSTAPGIASWDAGDYTVNINHTAMDVNSQLVRVDVCDFDGSTYTSVASNTSPGHAAGGTGPLAVTCTAGAAHTPQSQANSRLYIVLSYNNIDLHGNTTVGITPSLTIVAPFTVVNDIVLTADSGSFTHSGQDATLAIGRAVGGESGSFNLTGQDASLAKGHVLSADSGAYATSGDDAGLKYSGALSFRTTDNAPSCSVGAFCSGGVDNNTNNEEITCEAGAASGSVGGGFNINASSTNEIGCQYEIEPASNVTWNGGPWTVRLNVNFGNTNVELTDVYICRVNSSCVNQETIGSSTGLSVAMTTGIKTVNVTGSEQSPAAGDKVEIICLFRETSGNLVSIFLTRDQDIDSPFTASANVVLSADSGSYSLSGQDAGLAAARTVAGDSGAFAFAGQDATLSVGGVLTADAGAYTLAGQDAGLTADRTAAADAGSYTFSGQDASLVATRTLAGEPGSYTFTGQDATLTGPVAGSRIDVSWLDFTVPESTSPTIAAGSGSFTLTGQDAGLVASRSLAADAGSYTLAGQDATLAAGIALAADSGSYTLTGQDASLTQTVAISAESGSYVFTGQDATLSEGGNPVLGAESGTYSLAGQDATLLQDATIPAESGTYTLAGQDAGLTRDATTAAESGSYALTGQAAGLAIGHVVTADAGSYALSGQDATLTQTTVVAADAGSYVLTGQDAALSVTGAVTLAAETGEFVLSGQDASLLATSVLTADAGSYTFTGQDAGLRRGISLASDAGSYTLTGQDAGSARTYSLAAESGAYALTGQDATLGGQKSMTADPGAFDFAGQDAELITSVVGPSESGTFTVTGAADFLRDYVLSAASGSYDVEAEDVILAYSVVIDEATAIDVSGRYKHMDVVAPEDQHMDTASEARHMDVEALGV